MLEVLAHVVVAELEQRRARERGGGLELLVGVRAGGEVDTHDARTPAPLASVVAGDRFDEAVLRERAQVVAARRCALAALGRALGGGRRALELKAGEDAEPGRGAEGSERCSGRSANNFSQ